ncbi:hypothetical protein CLOM_g10926, partial [Closterium sp. NIES-68]
LGAPISLRCLPSGSAQLARDRLRRRCCPRDAFSPRGPSSRSAAQCGLISRGAATTLIPCDDDDRLRRRPQRPRDRFLAPAAVASSETRSSLVIGSAAISRRCLAWYVWGKGPCGGGSL